MGWLVMLAAGPAMAFQASTPQEAASQVHSSADAQLQAAVRKVLANDTSLSDAGHRVEVIVSDGAVVLRGPVKNDTEALRVETLTRQVNGVKEVTNELDVMPRVR
ncbi:hypothetical protein Y882_10040 [Dyella japonica DSM 16301]|uniref:BON domain-containing protein n=2 Tax=Dyella japonica TaxID=231455 RepID=A0A0G9H261_9GAMM|nr:hypothetical protein Y882_10040 [Dyella japonica DSM 16301]